jgi:hypothetical protein
MVVYFRNGNVTSVGRILNKRLRRGRWLYEVEDLRIKDKHGNPKLVRDVEFVWTTSEEYLNIRPLIFSKKIAA